MPEDSKKKNKSEAKEQRKKRQGRHQADAGKNVEKAPEKKAETAPEVAKELEKPAYEPPGPEFYNNLKRETDEILKITEEVDAKYKKKEIQSNWAKYEMPIETYEEIDEQENLGADYETLIQASFSVGGHFQFKHEKSWDITTGPTPYDKYFDINMESLNTALSTIPFYERNHIEKSVFTESDIQSMEHRATKFKQKYYKDKKYTTPDLEAQEKILNNLKNSDNEANNIYVDQNKFQEINIENTSSEASHFKPQDVNENQLKELPLEFQIENKISEISINNDVPESEVTKISSDESNDNQAVHDNLIQNASNDGKGEIQVLTVPKEIELPKAPKEYTVQPKMPPKNPIIESPEDLEKWLDDFLDG